MRPAQRIRSKRALLPETVGLSNVGVPKPVPLVSGEGRRVVANERTGRQASSPR